MRIGIELSETKVLQKDLCKEKRVRIGKCDVLQAGIDKLRKAKENVIEKLSLARRNIEDSAMRTINNSVKAFNVPDLEKTLNEERMKKRNF